MKYTLLCCTALLVGIACKQETSSAIDPNYHNASKMIEQIHELTMNSVNLCVFLVQLCVVSEMSQRVATKAHGAQN